MSPKVNTRQIYSGKILKNQSKSQIFLSSDQLELKKNIVLNRTIVDKKNQGNADLINQYSSFIKLLKITAWCLRFLKNSKLETRTRKNDYLDTSELQHANKQLLMIL